VICFDGREASETHSDQHSDSLGFLGGDFDPRIRDRFGRSANGVLGKEVHPFDLSRLDELTGIEVTNLSRDLYRKPGGIEFLDFLYPRFSFHQAAPIFFDSRSEGGY
jgi:hypothetical protein